MLHIWHFETICIFKHTWSKQPAASVFSSIMTPWALVFRRYCICLWGWKTPLLCSAGKITAHAPPTRSLFTERDRRSVKTAVDTGETEADTEGRAPHCLKLTLSFVSVNISSVSNRKQSFRNSFYRFSCCSRLFSPVFMTLTLKFKEGSFRFPYLKRGYEATMRGEGGERLQIWR